MSQDSKIEWTDATWNPVRGCTKVSPGCANCYAETFAERWRGVKGHPYEQGFDLMLVPSKLDDPLKRKTPTTYFVNSMSDLFQDGVPDEYIAQVFAVMALCPQHTFQVLTKRASRMQAQLTDMSSDPDAFCFAWAREYERGDFKPTPPLQSERWPLPNVWLGVSVENQYFADGRIPLLLQTPAAVRFISAEPLLGPVNLRTIGSVPNSPFGFMSTNALESGSGLHWVIVGGESGPRARHCDLAWVRAIVQDCSHSDVRCFVKQLGSMPFDPDRVDEKLGYVDLKSRKGGDMSEWPADLRVREFPLVGAVR